MSSSRKDIRNDGAPDVRSNSDSSILEKRWEESRFNISLTDMDEPTLNAYSCPVMELLADNGESSLWVDEISDNSEPNCAVETPDLVRCDTWLNATESNIRLALDTDKSTSKETSLAGI